MSPPPISAQARRVAIMMMVALGLWLLPTAAQAYPWMIRHAYGGCAMCHSDPSGAGLLTPYGRAQGDLLLRTRYGGASEEPGSSAGFLWGAFDPPEWLLLGGAFRPVMVASKAGTGPTLNDLILMQADLRAEVRVGGLRANGSFGAVSTPSMASVVGNAISREHWLGYSFGDEAFLVRAGRIDLPFGVRSIEHTLWVRNATHTDINDTQEHGVAFAYSGESFRAELMGIAGNFQVSPDQFRNRGYSGFVEWTPAPRYALGASSLLTHTKDDLWLRVASTRQAHGLFARLSPWTPIVLLAEGDVVLQSPSGISSMTGLATMLQADIEPVQGLHFIATGETYAPGGTGSATSYGGWAGVNWFFAPHADVRIDGMLREQVLGSTTLPIKALIVNLHAYL